MKRAIYILLALWAVISCSDDSSLHDDSAVVDSSQLIGVAVDALTRGEVVTSAAQMGSVGLYCARTNDVSWADATDATVDYRMQDTEMIYTTTDGWCFNEGEEVTWGHESQSELFTFFGYSPYDLSEATIALTTGGNMTVEYQMPAACDAQNDIVVAQPRIDITPQTGGVVYLTFYHLLCCVSVEVTNLPDGVTVESIAISDLYNIGSTTINTPTTDVDYQIATWLLGTTTATATMSATSYSDGDAFMLLPQTLGEDVTLTITFSNSSSKSFGLSDLTTQWELGQKYSYSYDYSSDSSGSTSEKENEIDLNGYGSDEELKEAIEDLIAAGYTYFVVTNDDGVTDLSTLNTLLSYSQITGLDISALDISSLSEVSGDGTDFNDYEGLSDSSTWAKITTLVLPSTITDVSDNSGSVYKWMDDWDTIKVLDMSATGITNIPSDYLKDMKNNNLETIIFPEGLISISSSAIYCANKLYQIYFFSSSVTVGTDAFKDLESGTLNVYIKDDAEMSLPAFSSVTTTQYPYYTYSYDEVGDIHFAKRTE